MAQRRTRLRIFIASPSDLRAEVARVYTVVAELNRGLAEQKKLVLECVHWRTHVAPDWGRPQKVILRQIQPEDIFIGIMWHTVGTPTDDAESGTIEEFELAHQLWEASGGEQGGRPRIMLYFNTKGPLPTSEELAQRLLGVLRFRARVKKQGLVSDYAGAGDFETKFREHLTNAIRSWRPQRQRKEQPKPRVSAFVGAGGLETAKATLVFADIEGFSQLNMTLGHEECDGILDEYKRLARRLVRSHHGFIITDVGDQVFAAFLQQLDAVDFSVEFLRHLRKSKLAAAIGARVGLHSSGRKLKTLPRLWTTARLAARVARLGAGGQILATSTARVESAGIFWHSHEKAKLENREIGVSEAIDRAASQEPRPLRRKRGKGDITIGSVFVST